MTDSKPSSSARAFVFAGPVLAFFITVFSLTTGLGLRMIGGVWFWATLWTVCAALACALWRGLRHGDWSAFSRYEFSGENGDRFDWATRTGRYAWRRDIDEQEFNGHDDPFGHGPIT